MAAIGHTVGTELQPNTAYAFFFWAQKDAGLGIGSMVKVIADETTIYGTVTEAHAYNDLPNALTDFLASEGVPGGIPPTARPEIRFFEAAVLRREPEEPVAAVGIGPVHKTDAEDLKIALRGDRFTDGIPIGAYGMKNEWMPVLADPEYLLGTEAGHLNVTGTSGLAAKTSYILFVLQSVFQNFKGTGDDGIAAVVFNVKGNDLLYLDHAPKDSLPDDSVAMYSTCGVTPKVFDKVHYCAPFGDAAMSYVNTLRDNEELTRDKETRGFCYGLEDVLTHAEVLLSKEDIDSKADAFLSFLRDDVAGKTTFRLSDNHEPIAVTSLDELLAAVHRMLELAEAGGSGYRAHHAATIRKILNRLNGFARRFPGLISETGQTQSALPEKLQDRTLYVIDVSQSDAQAQDLIFAAVIGELKDRMERKELGVARTIVVVDELNKYAPSGGTETYVVRNLRDIAARGRYMGLVLFGAQQFRSRVDAQVIGNCANSAYGHIQMEELTNSIYTVYSQAVREKMANADPGEMMIRHPRFSQPIFVRFPMPYCLKGSDGINKYPSPSRRSLEERLAENFRKKDPTLSPADIASAFGALDANTKEETLREMSRKLAKLNGDVKAVRAILQGTGKRAPTLNAPNVGIDDPGDPFA